MIPDWLQPTFLLLPALLWIFFGVGVPWALALLPRADWPHRVTVAAVALALGPALTTTIMFLIATLGRLTLANILASSASIALIGVALASRQLPLPDASPHRPPFQRRRDEINWINITLIIVIGVAVLLRFWNTAYWPYENYDEFWVYGYNAKIFMMQRAVPASMGYYPQLLPLSMTYAQLAWGTLSEHAARAVVPYFGLGSILITYVLGARLFSARINQRAGLIGAAVWALYAHHAGWAQYADLEVPITFYFTGAVAFFILAWRDQKMRYAILGGVFAGAALWTKPTAGALIESVGLIVAVLIVQRLLSKHSRAAIISTLSATPILLFVLALLPMGGMWYVRNVLFGLPPIILPAGYWQDAAQRSGQELGWPLLVIACLAILLIKEKVVRQRELVSGLAFLFGGALPSALDLPHPHRLTLLEYAILAAGALLFARAIWAWMQRSRPEIRTTILLLYAFIVPYFVTWFWSYSYHYRLSFAMVPLFTVQVGLLLNRFWSPLIGVKRFRVALASVSILILALPGWSAALSGLDDALYNRLPDDHAKQAVANPALLTLVDDLQAAREVLGRPLRVAAPGELRLPFFFPMDDLRVTSYPTKLDQIADVDYFVDSSVGQRLYLINGAFTYNQILSSLTRDPVLKRQMTTDDGDFRFSLYTVDNAARFKPPQPNVPLNVQIGDFARLVGWEISRLENQRGERVSLTLYWQAIKASDVDYSVYIHLWDATAQKLVGNWGGEPVSGAFSVWQGVPGDHFSVDYHTRLWQDGEYIKDEWLLRIPKDTLPGEYELRVGLFEPLNGNRLPVLVNGIPAGDGLKLSLFKVLP